MATIRDVAEKAGVSTATVSRVLNKQMTVTPETRERVEKVIKELNYQPNLLGRNLRRSETKMILVLLQNIGNPFYAKVVQGIEATGLKNGYNIMICNTDSDPEREKTYLELLLNRLVDGVVLMEPEIDVDILTYIGKNFPLIQCCEFRKEADIPYVSIDNVAAAYTAVKHLLELGHRNIGMLSAFNRIPSALDREKGYKKALKEEGLSFDQNLIAYSSYGFKGGMSSAKKLLKRKKRPTAIFAISDIMAIGVIQAAKELGLRVPEDLAVIGFDNTSISAMYDPKISTIAQPRFEMGKTAMNRLLKQLKGEKVEFKGEFLEHELIIRESTIKRG